MRRRRSRRCQPFGRLESLETRRLLAVDVVQPFVDITVDAGTQALVIDLAAAFDLAEVTGTVVRFTSDFGPDIYAELFDQIGVDRARTTPETVANFLAYVDAGGYTDTIFHRSVPGFIVQAGGFRLAESGPNLVESVVQFGPVVNEPGNTNVRGTLAMAKLGDNPNSATNQFFVNLADNSGNLDSQNGGFTAFGRVLGDGMTFVDTNAALPRYNFGSPFDELPAAGVDNPASIGRENLVAITGVSRVSELVFTAASSNPAVAAVAIAADGRLTVNYTGGPLGTATITVRAASVFDASDFTETSFGVTLVPAATDVNSLVGLAGDTLLVARSTGAGFAADSSVSLPSDGGWVELVEGDFNGDGRSDVATLSTAGRWWVTLTPATGSAQAPQVWGSLPTTIGWQFFTAGDYNADGRDDIAVWNPESGGWRVLVSDGTSFSSSEFGNWSPATAWTTPLVGDFDGDGRSDLAARDPGTGAWWIGRSDGSSFTSSIWRRQRTEIEWRFLKVGDFNADGRSDIATWNARSGAWRVLTSTGTGFTNTKFDNWLAAADWGDIVVGDFDGDGRSDIAGRDDGNGQWSVARSSGSGFSTTGWGSLRTEIAWKFVTPGDFDGNGRSDIAAWNPTSGTWRVLASMGNGFAVSSFGAWPAATAWSKVRGLRV